MAYRDDLSTIPVSSTQTSKRASYVRFVARVLDIILDETHPDYSVNGGPDSIGAVKVQLLTNYSSNSSNGFIAFPMNTSVKKLPLVNELVVVEANPSRNIDKSSYSTRYYYTDIVGIWNHPHHNAYPETTLFNGELDLGNGFQEAADINPLQPFPGDILFEGRQGQSIRFTGAFHPKNPFSTPFNAGFPLTIISNGQIPTANGFDPIVEDINKDASSIYLTAGHKVNLIPASTKRTSYTTIPAEPSNYQGSQVLINSDRLYLNASKESILMSSANSIGLSASTLNFDSQGTTVVDGSKIEFGKDATQPILKGNDTVKLLRDLITELQALSTAIVAAGGQPNGPFPTLIDAGTSLTKLTTTLLTELEPLKSKLTYTK